MPITRLDSTCALIVIDLQKGLRPFPFVHPIDDIVARTQTLLAAFRRTGQPVAWINAAGGPPGRTDTPPPDVDFPEDWTDLLPELDVQPGDIRVTKYAWGALLGTDLLSALNAAGVTQVVLAGIVTSMGVESTAREAFSLGFNVTLAVDAMTDLSDDAHDYSTSRIFPRLGETGQVDEIVALLDTRRG